MAKEHRDKGKRISNTSSQSQTVKDALSNRGLPVWIREDGAVCFGSECVVIKPSPGSKDLEVEINPGSCGSEAGPIILDHLLKTVGKGGNTKFTVKSEFHNEGKGS